MKLLVGAGAYGLMAVANPLDTALTAWSGVDALSIFRRPRQTYVQ